MNEASRHHFFKVFPCSFFPMNYYYYESCCLSRFIIKTTVDAKRPSGKGVILDPHTKTKFLFGMVGSHVKIVEIREHLLKFLVCAYLGECDPVSPSGISMNYLLGGMVILVSGEVT